MKGLCALALVAIAALPSFGQVEDAELRREIQGVYNKWDRLIARGDTKKMLAMVDPSWTMVDTSGTRLGYADMKAMISTMSKSVRSMTSRIVVNSVQGYGDEATAWVTSTESFQLRRGKKWITVKQTNKYAETLRKVDGQWRFVYTQGLPNAALWGWSR